MIEDVEVTCPACWECIALTVDLSAGSTAYTEDCSVCCRPMLVRVDVAPDGDWQVDVQAEND
ncbi:MAG: CPXCG motif-containing cysteine-rich protein [Algiphilus sp.]